MYVIMDMEWITSSGGVPCPTQIAALRVDSHWRRTGIYHSLIHPRDKSCLRWNHMAYTCNDRKRFLSAPNAIPVFRALFEWLRDDDVLLWWEKNSAEVFVNAVRHMLNREVTHPIRLLRNRAAKACRITGNPYQLAVFKGLAVPPLQHVSTNDVEVIRRLCAFFPIDQNNILDTLEGKEKPRSAIMMYFHDPSTNLLHKVGGGCTFDDSFGFSTFKSCLRKGFQPCPVCMAEEYRRESMKLTADVIDRSQYNFVFQPKSEVFHKAECFQALRIPYWEIKGTINYKVCLEHGKRPCQLCNPTKQYRRPRVLNLDPSSNPVMRKETAPALIPGLTRTLTTAETRAFNRHLEASRNRSAISGMLGPLSRDDAYTRTSSGYAFWAGRGCRTFHLAGCPKLKGLSGLKGFSQYKQATDRGFEPCKLCKPRSKNDLVISVPSGSAIRPGETPALLDHLCGEFGYCHRQDTHYYYIETPVGKWKLDITALPVDLWHINLVNNPNDDYHSQPRLILSLSDAFWYIHRHDKTLLDCTPLQDDIDAVIQQMDDELQQLGVI